jgi:methionyl aminopeptidase
LLPRSTELKRGATLGPWPDVPNVYDPALGQPLTEGLVITIEPLVAAGESAVRMAADGWTVRTADASLAAHVEHTVVVRDGAPLVLTA